MKTFTKKQMQKIYPEILNELDNQQAEPTGRVIYPAAEPEHAGMEEYTASVEADGLLAVAYYYQSTEEVERTADLSLLDWEAEYYTVEEVDDAREGEVLKMFGGYTKEELEAEGWVITDEAWAGNDFRNYVGYHEALGITVEHDGSVHLD